MIDAKRWKARHKPFTDSGRRRSSQKIKNSDCCCVLILAMLIGGCTFFLALICTVKLDFQDV